ncbi:WD40 repeat domain-containing protein [Catalinimonas sp. 4WD22]|uniref:WD40 repeat domain-containing protein n=1 Tax=Catalinimonas locisalis TaxID=3133978 RepID=UPI0031015B8F
MKFIFLLILSVSLLQTGYAQEEKNLIYNSEAPDVFPLWHRVADFSTKLRAVEAAELSPDGRLAVSGSKFGYKVMLWRTADGSLVWENEHESEVECVVFSPDGKRVASGGEDFYVRIWDVESGKQLAAWEHDSGLDGITWSHDSKLIATGSEAGDAWLWDGDTYEMLAKIKAGSTINSLDFTKDDSRLVVAGNIQTPDPETGKTHYAGFVSLIDVQERKVIRQYEGHEASVKSVRISDDEQFIATGSFDSTARVFNFRSGALLQTFKRPLRVEAIAFTPDGQYLAIGSQEPQITFIRMSDYKKVFELPCPRVEYLDFSDDGRLLLTSHEDSGLLSLYMMLSNSGRTGVYQRIANDQLKNRDLQE